jgi:A/G-specific adenine glycosylase
MVRGRAHRDNSNGTGQPAKSRRRTARQALAAKLLAWYDENRRDLPWRAPAGETPDPYAVWLSEIMLQQTTVAAVAPYYLRFLARWPDVHGLARAPLDRVLQEWQGLGYYARARNLHACAKAVSGTLGGRFPDTEDGLRELPGIGPYTAAAIAAIAFGRPAAAVDGNVERVMARLFGVTTPLPQAKRELRAKAAGLVPETRAGDYAQAAMDLGATLCTPRSPACPSCPWRGPCVARAEGTMEELPRRAAKPVRPLRRGVAFFLTRKDGAICLRRRPERGLLGGMMEVPSTPWRAQRWDEAEIAPLAPVRAPWRRVPGHVAHGFTHFRLELRVVTGKANGRGPKGGVWVRPEDLGQAALPTIMKKVIRHALAHAGGRQGVAKKESRPPMAPGGRDIVGGELCRPSVGGTERPDDVGINIVPVG